MKHENWNYFLQVDFNINKVSPSKHPSGVKMYFTNLQDAFSRCVQINPYGFIDRGLANSPDYFPVEKSPIASATLTGKEGAVLLGASLQQESREGGAFPAGLYYNFPEGIKTFEKELGRSLKDFKGYAPGKDYLLVSYLVDPKELKHTLAFSRLREQSDGKKIDSEVFPVQLNCSYFGYSSFSPRSVDPNPYQEIFYHKDAMAALKHLLSLNFNQLSEDIAWEKDQPFFYSSCRLFEGFNQRATLQHSQKGPFYCGPSYVDEAGVYLYFKSKFDDDRINISLAPFVADHHRKDLYKVGAYDEKTMQFVLDKSLALSLKPKSPKTKVTRKGLR